MAEPRQPLGPAVVTLLVVDAVLVLVLAVLAFQAFRPAATGGGDATPSTVTGTPGAEFASPSRNIACTLGSDAVTCTIAEFSYPAPQVEGCDGDVGHALTLTADGARWDCVEGDPPGPAAADVEVLPYGGSVTVASFTCTSAESGVTCREAESGHSFTLARGGATLD